ncbi:MAG: dihydrolipoamide acetyltransferase family protein [Phycisphaerales bacterium]|jgi:pyruvate dehydrogenase E2 component (dihydrolipoamide acetyltransferase)|nr:dihydrolipoamide acetyltransferase family protein [Phycisphaerales bacterium]MDP6889895.1 dihydrolipoamide acetyltransferase family protein [Phycisphaerales bacterium]
MPIEITMPRLSDTMEKGTIIKWHIAEGDDVTAGDILADVETDKATMEMQAFDDGRVSRIAVDEGVAVAVGTVVAVIVEEDDEPAASASSEPAASPTESPALADDPVAAPCHKVTSVARRLAEQHGVDLSGLEGSGPGGRITKRDVLAAVGTSEEMRASVPPSAQEQHARPDVIEPSHMPVPAVPVTRVATSLAGTDSDRREPVSIMRQTIARRLVESKQEIPHYQVSMVFAMDAMMALRKDLNTELADQGVRLSVNDLLVRACAVAMNRNPLMNASWDGDAIVYHGEVNIGVAVALPEERGGGLVVPVLRNADSRSLRAISAETRALSEKARTRGLTVEEMEGATFTISNLGMFGVDAFTAIINPPNSAILAVGACLQKPVVRDGELTIGWEMNATLSNDHRVVDGATAARYLGTLKEFIEHPAAILV